MACAHPLLIDNPYFKNISASRQNYYFSPTNPYQFEVPCGYCLNCRVDKRNFYEDVFKYHFNKHGCGAFVTLTYDDYHLPFSKNGDLTLSKEEASKFIQRLKKRVSRLPYFVPGIHPDFAFICVGEYGGSGHTSILSGKRSFLEGRPHLHFLFAGLDWKVINQLLRDTWKGGIIDCKPIKKGGIRYVLKYYDKQQTKKTNQSLFVDKGICPPFKKQSFGICSDFILSKRDEILSSHGEYKVGNKSRPVPNYYKKMLFTGLTDSEKWSKLLQRSKLILQSGLFQPKNKMNYSLMELNSIRHKLNVLKEEKLYRALNQYVPYSPDLYGFEIEELIS